MQKNLDIKIHYYQKKILQELISSSVGLNFNKLVVAGLESEHMNYHLQKLISFNLVEKSGQTYKLTDSGKEYVNRLDDANQIVEVQPKTSIIIRGIRVNPETGEIEHLLNKRLKQPYYGKVGRITGKVRYGETFEQAAKRELFEETGLEAKNFRLEEIYRKLRHRENGEYVQDVIFYIFHVTDFYGTLIEKSEIQENFWITSKAAGLRDDTYDDLDLHDTLEPMSLRLVESVAQVEEGF